jgi:hypothetical protein
MSRVKDAPLMHELKELWREFGCAICGRGTDEAPPEGFDVELHHVVSRGQGGPDAAWNVVGLCGGLTENRCHQKVTEHVYEIRRNDQGILVWRDRRAGGQLWKSLRFIPQFSQIPPAGGSDASAVDDTPPGVDVAEPEPYSDAPGVSEDPSRVERSAVVTVPAAAAERQPSPEDSPEERASQIRERVTRSKRLLMEAAILLRHAYERGDHAALGVTWVDYYSSIGLERSNVSKMLQAAKVLGAEWQQLTPKAREHVSVESLYQASRLVTEADWAPDAAIDAAVANPTSRLIALRTGDEPAAKCRCTCENCGRELWHERAQPSTRSAEPE